MGQKKRTRIAVPKSKRGIVILIAVALGLAVSAAVAQVWTHQQAIAYGYSISKETTRRAKLLQQNRRLHIELAVLKDPARISKLGRQRYGLRDPEPEQIRRLRLPKLTFTAGGNTPSPAVRGLWGPRGLSQRNSLTKRAGLGVAP